MTIRRVAPGMRFKDFLKTGLTADAWNDIAEMGAWFKTQRRDVDRGVPTVYPHPGVVQVRNDTGADLPWFGIVALGGPLFDPAADDNSLLEFQQEPTFKGLVPATLPDPNRFAVVLQPLEHAVSIYTGSPGGDDPSGYSTFAEVGRAVIAGCVQVKVNVTNLTHGFAAPLAGNTTYLASNGASGAIILTPPSATGLQWLQVLLGACCSDNFGQTSSGSGNVGTHCSLCAGTQTLPANLNTSFTLTNNFCTDCASIPACIDLNIESGFCARSSPIFVMCGGQQFWLYFAPSGAFGIPFQCTGDWELGVYSVSDGTWEVLYCSTTTGWDCNTSSLTLTRQGGAGGLHGYCNWPATITVSKGACSGGGGGGGGGCNIVPTSLGVANSTTPITMAGISLASGVALLVEVHTPLNNGAITGVTWNGNALTRDIVSTSADVGEVSIWRYVTTGAATGSIVVSASSPVTCFVSAVEVSGLASNAVDLSNSATGGAGTDPIISLGGNTAGNCGYVISACLYAAGVGDFPGFASPFTLEQDPGNATQIDPYRYYAPEGDVIETSPANPTAHVVFGPGSHPTFWNIVIVAYK